MDLNDLRVWVTVVSFVLFVALMVFTYRRQRRQEHAHAAMLPFTGDGEVIHLPTTDTGRPT